MEPINIQEIKVNDQIQYFDTADQKWCLAKVVLTGLNFVYIIGLTGTLINVQWTENYTKLTDPDYYLTYEIIPTPPQKLKKRRMVTPTMIMLITFIILAIANIIVTIIFR